MSRSYHSNRSWRYRVQQGGLDLEDVEEIWRKRNVKRATRQLRQAGKARQPELPRQRIPVEVVDSHPALVFPASADDFESVVARIADPHALGVSRISLRLGLHEQEEAAASWTEEDPYERDPVFDRPGRSLSEGLYSPLRLGTYLPDVGEIYLYGYVLTPDADLDGFERFVLKLRFLHTFLHELAHHRQQRSGLRRARPPITPGGSIEDRADTQADEWFRGPVRALASEWAETIRVESATLPPSDSA